MALKLKGSTSGFVGLDAPSVAGNNTLILPENSGSAFQLFANDITAGVTTFTSVTVNRNGDLTVPGTISIGGTLTYEDVTSVDSVGIVTARGLSIFGNTTGLQVSSGISTFQAITGTTGTFSGDVSIADKIIHTGDTNTAIRFPSVDTITAETSGTEAIRINNSGQFLVGVTAARTMLSGYTPSLQVEGTANSDSSVSIVENISAASGPSLWFGKTRGNSLGANTVVQSGDELGTIVFNGADGTDVQSMAAFIRASVDGTPGSNDMPGRITIHTTADGAASPTERVRIDSNGYLIAKGDIRLRRTASNNGALYFGDTNNNYIFGTDADDVITFATAGTERLRIDSSGNMGLGIGGAISDARFRIKGANNSTNTYNDGLMVTSNNETVYKKYSWAGIEAKGGITFHEAGSGSVVETMRIATNGNVNIGQGGSVAGLKYFDVQNDSSADNAHGSIIRLITSNAAGNSTTSVDMVKYKDGNFFISNNEATGEIKFNTGGSTNLNINADGYVTKPNHPCFRAGRSTTQTPGTSGTIVFDYVTSPTHFNQGGHYDTSTGAFTAPVAGVYSFHCQVLFQNLSDGQNMADPIYFRYNSSGGASGGVLVSYDQRRAEYINNETGQGGYYSAHTSVIVKMVANSSVYVRNNRAGLEVHGNANYTYFQGYLIG